MRIKNTILSILVIIVVLASIFYIGADNIHAHGEEVRAAWTYVADSPESGGYGECVGSDGEYLYILYDYSSSTSPYFWRFDPATDSFTQLNASLPNGTFQNGVAMAYDYSGNFYILTGSKYAGLGDRVAFYKFNISTETWYRLANTPHVQGAGDAIVYSAYDGKIYAFIGRAHYTGSYKPDNYSVFVRYDPATNSWSYLNFPDWPGTDDGCSLTWTGGRYIYALEGEFYENSPISSFARYDIETNTWEDMSDIPTKDGVGDGGSLLWIGYYDSRYSDIIYALDGNGCNETPGYNFSAYHISTDTWEKLDSLPYPVGDYVGNRLAYVDGKIYYWQGTPSTWDGGGTKICSWTPTPPIPELNIWFVIVVLLGTLALSCRRKSK